MEKQEIRKTARDMALWLASEGCAVMPLEPRSKVPHKTLLPIVNDKVTWKPYIDRHPDADEINRWFDIYPNINIGLICGTTSGIVAIDVDGVEGQKFFQENFSPVCKPNLFQTTSTEYKFHAIYKIPQGVTIHPTVKKIHDEIDVRGEHSYIVVAPSIHPSGAQYRLYSYGDFNGIKSLKELPDIKLPSPQSVEKEIAFDEDIPEGQRDDTLTRLTGQFFGRGFKKDDVLLHIHAINESRCKPPLPEKQVTKIVDSVYRMHREHNFYALNADGISNWINQQGDKEFTIDDAMRQLNAIRRDDKAIILEAINRGLETGVLERPTGRANTYRKTTSIERIDITTEDCIPEIKLYLLFQLERCLKIQPKNIILVAGESNSGKTAFLFNLVYINQNIQKFRYITSEMTKEEIQARISKFGMSAYDFSKFCEFYACCRDYSAAIDPDGINIIDFLEVYDNFSRIGEEIKKIFDKLRSGIAIIAIQKKRGETYGRGGEFTIEKARLAISLFTHGRLPDGIIGSMKIVKCKNFRGEKNPEGQEIFYQLTKGYIYNVNPVRDWYKKYYSEKERNEMIRDIETYCTSVQNDVLTTSPYGEPVNGRIN